MSKMLLSIPDKVARQFKAMIPVRKRSQFLTQILEKALNEQEVKLYNAALMAEKDEILNLNRQEWDTTLGDGLDNLVWDTQDPFAPKLNQSPFKSPKTSKPKRDLNAPKE